MFEFEYEYKVVKKCFPKDGQRSKKEKKALQVKIKIHILSIYRLDGLKNYPLDFNILPDVRKIDAERMTWNDGT